jgi:hypothetical protein
MNMTAAERKTILATPQPNCVACRSQSVHTENDWKHHPFRGHGYVGQGGWSHPDLAPKAVALISSATATPNPPPTGEPKL